jgi:recombination protein RecR
MLPLAIINLAEKFRTLPGIGNRSSQKMALDVLQSSDEDFANLIIAMHDARHNVRFCNRCGFFAEAELCNICSNNHRSKTQICIVEKPTEVITLEKSEIYNGSYHVLKKLISPLDNVFAENTTVGKMIDNINELILDNKDVELILFLKPGFANEATTAYIKEILKNKNWLNRVSITRLAQGLPLYYNSDTLDTATMVRALTDRREI